MHSLGGHIARFELRKLFQSKEIDTLTPDAISQTEFPCFYENSFGMLANQATVIGVKYDELNNHSMLVQERIDQYEFQSRPSVVEFGQHNNKIYTVLIMQEYNFVFAGDRNCNVT